MNLEVIMDEPPKVTLDGAPREVRLAEVNEAIAIHYEATDDHGLRDVELVLRAGNREERRELARLDGETTSFSGATLLSVRDPFFAVRGWPWPWSSRREIAIRCWDPSGARARLWSSYRPTSGSRRAVESLPFAN